MRKFVYLIPLLASLLAGCSQLEYRADMPEKRQLAKINCPLNITQKWGVYAGDGVGKDDYRFVIGHVGDTLYVVDHSGVVGAYNASNGSEIWRTCLYAPASAGPGIGEGKIIIGTSDGKLIALDQNGKHVWTTSTTSEILAVPKITSGMVLVHTMDGGISAYSLVDGRQLWRFTHNLPPLMLRRSSAPAVHNDMVFAGLANGKLIAMRKHDGSPEWSHDVTEPKGGNDLQRMVDISAEPVVLYGKVYAVSYQGNLAALREGSGQMAWERSIGSYAGFVIEDDIIYVSGSQGEIYALDASNGDTYWKQEEFIGRLLTKPVISGNYLIVADEDSAVHWLDKTTGARVGRFKIDSGGVDASPIVIDNIVYILGRNGKLVALATN